MENTNQQWTASAGDQQDLRKAQTQGFGSDEGERSYMSAKPTDDRDDDDDENEEEEEENTDWGHTDPQDHPGPPDPMDPSGPGSAV